MKQAGLRPVSGAPKPRRVSELELGWLRVAGRELRTGVWRGAADRPPLLIFNGIGARLELLDSFVAELDPGREIVSFDMPGAGESPAPLLPYRPWMLARLTSRVLDALGYAEVDAMGISWGGAIAQQFAVQAARRCRRLILAATTPGPLVIPRGLGAALATASPRRYADRAYLRTHFGTLYGGDAHTSPDLFSRFAEHARPASRRGYVYQQLALAGWTSLPFLPLLRQPALILAGDDDPLVAAGHARMMARLIPQARLQVLGDGHLFILSRAHECATAVDRFLDAEPAPRAPAASHPVHLSNESTT